MRIAPFTTAHQDAWDAFVQRSHNGTFLHTRRFLSYHGDRFVDASLMLLDDRDRLLGVLPAAFDPADQGVVVSHPGITYGGLVHDARLQGEGVIEALAAVVDVLRARGARSFVYKAIPTIYQVHPAEDERYALLRLGAEIIRCDLSAAIDVARRPPRPASLERKLAKARRLGVTIVRGPALLSGFWEILQASLRRHAVEPVHRLEEMVELQRRFPDHISFVGAAIEGELLAGNVLFTTAQTIHAQYGAASERGRECAAQDLLDDACITDSAALGMRYFDFGISTEQDGSVLNEGLRRYKAKFGAGGITHDFYRWQLST